MIDGLPPSKVNAISTDMVVSKASPVPAETIQISELALSGTSLLRTRRLAGTPPTVTAFSIRASPENFQLIASQISRLAATPPRLFEGAVTVGPEPDRRN